MRKIVPAGLALACALAFSGDALAKKRHPRQTQQTAAAATTDGRGALEVQRRSWLDPGTQVPVGSNNRYVLQQTFYNQDPIQKNQRSWYMQETLPSREEVIPYDPGWPFQLP